jgi:chromosome partitioning protein
VDQGSWTEPALPGLPAAPAPAEGASGGSHDTDASEDALVEPDPSWPRLFERGTGNREPEDHPENQHGDGTGEVGHPEQDRPVEPEATVHEYQNENLDPSQSYREPEGDEQVGESDAAAPHPASTSLESSSVDIEQTPFLEPTIDADGPVVDESAMERTTTASAGPATETVDRPGAVRESSARGDVVSSAGFDERPAFSSALRPEDRPEVVDITADAQEGAKASTPRGVAQQAPRAEGGSREVAASGTPIGEQANISTVARIVDVEEVDLRESSAGPPHGDVSRETSAGGGEEMDKAHEDDALEDEAALAVRDAVSRAAAEAGVDVSRETELTSPGEVFDGPAGSDSSFDSETAARNARVTFRIHRDSLNGPRRVLAVANQKGGVGKSTTAVNIGAYLALAGARVLVVDLDPQGNASTGLGLDHREIEPSIYDVLTGEAPPAAAIRATSVDNLHILPSTIDLAGAEVELVSAMSRETRLRRALESVDHQYDTILIDCPPSLGLLTVNALAAANELLIPIQCEYYALEGLGQLLRNVELVRANLNPELRIGGIVLTMYDGRTRLALQVVDEVRKHFTDVVYQTVVPRSVRLSEAPGYGLPIALYDPLSRGGIAYRDLTFELAERSGLLAPTGEGAS